MSLSAEQLLVIRKALADKVASTGIVCFPTGIRFSGREDYWANVDSTKTTQKQIDTSQIVALWIRYLTFSDTAEKENDEPGEADSPIVTREYEFTLFRSRSIERVDESDEPDDFRKRLLKTEIEMEADIQLLINEFRGIQTLEGLPEADFAVRETNSISQEEFVDYEAECEFIKGVEGSQVRLVCPVKIQLVEC